MSADSLTWAVPHSLARELDSVGEDLLVDLLERGLREFQIERGLDRYARGGISLGAAVRQADVSRSEFARHAYARGMELPFSAETLAEELD